MSRAYLFDPYQIREDVSKKFAAAAHMQGMVRAGRKLIDPRGFGTITITGDPEPRFAEPADILLPGGISDERPAPHRPRKRPHVPRSRR